MARAVDDREARLRRARWGFGVLGLLLLIAFVAALAGITRDVYSPQGVVQGYLQALANHDLRSVSEIDGVPAPEEFPEDQRTILLSEAALGRIDDIRIVESLEIEPGLVQVTAAYRLAPAGAESPGYEYQRSFLMERGERAWFFFDRWGFAEPPIETVQIQIKHDRRFTANGQAVQGLGVAAGAVTPYLVYGPGIYRIDYQDEYLRADPEDLVVTGDGGTVIITLRPTDAFVERVQQEVNAYLDSCAEQRVLQPTGCPFGHFVSDRIISEPQWTITRYPDVTIKSDREGFYVPRSTVEARLRVQVQALYDGSISTLDVNEGGSTGFRLTIQPDGSVTIRFANVD